MNRDDYRAAFDAVEFSGDFQTKTIQRLERAQLEQETKEYAMTMGKFKKCAVLIAAALTLLAVSVSAAILLLTPEQVATKMERFALAEAFTGKDAILIDETRAAGDYNVTLMGIVSGAQLSDWGDMVQEERSYIMAALSPLDGTPLEQTTYDPFAYTITPLVSGYRVNAVNNWTLDASAQCKVIDGIAYYIIDTQNLEIFADHTVYLAIYEGGAPGLDEFSMSEDGSIIMREHIRGALFVLPLDANKADPEAAKALVEATGLDYTPIVAP